MANDEIDAAHAKEEYGDRFETTFTYRRGRDHLVMKKVSAIAKQYRTLTKSDWQVVIWGSTFTYNSSYSVHTFHGHNNHKFDLILFLPSTLQEQAHDRPHAKHFITGARLKSKNSSRVCDGSSFHEIRYLTIVMWEYSMLQPPHSHIFRRGHLRSTDIHWHPPRRNEWVP